MVIDWAALRAAATAAAAPPTPLTRACASALRAGLGRPVVAGCNVENASYGLTLCAECGLVSALHAAGAGQLVAVSVVAADGAPLVPVRPLPPAAARSRRPGPAARRRVGARVTLGELSARGVHRGRPGRAA